MKRVVDVRRGKGRAVRFAVLAATVAAVAAGAGGSTARSGDVDPTAFLLQYAPVLYFHPDEDWAPERVESFLSRARTERQIAPGSWAAVAGPLPTTTSG